MEALLTGCGRLAMCEAMQIPPCTIFSTYALGKELFRFVFETQNLLKVKDFPRYFVTYVEQTKTVSSISPRPTPESSVVK
jgi:hypothetical protein